MMSGLDAIYIGDGDDVARVAVSFFVGVYVAMLAAYLIT